MRSLRTVTEKYYVLTVEWADPTVRPDCFLVEPPDDVEDADRMAQHYLARGAVRVCVEPFTRRVSEF